MNIFDKNLKKKLYNAELPVSEGIWENIEAQIPVKQDKPKYWILFLVALFALPFLIYPLTKSDKQSAAAEEGIQKEINQNHRVENQENGDNISFSESIEMTNEAGPDETTRQTNSDDNLATTHLSEVAIDASLNKLDINSDENYVAFSDRNSQGNSSNRKRSNSSILSNNSDLHNKENINLSSLAKNLSERQNLFTESSTPSGKKLKFLRKPISTNIDLDNSDTGFKLIEKSRIFQKAQTIKAIPSVAGSVVPNFAALDYNREEEIGIRLLGLKKASPICPTFKPFRSGIYVFTDIRAGLSTQQLENKTENIETDAIISQRSASESSAISSSFNIGVGKRWNSGILVESGLNIDVISTTLSFLQPGETIIVIDSFPEITMDTTNTAPQMVRTKNKFRQVNIPVNLGYEFRISERYSIAAKAGILINLASSNSGQLITESGLVAYDSSDRNSNFFKTNLNLSYSGGLDLIGDINNNFSGYIGLNFNYYPSDFSLSTYSIRQSYYKAGVTAGLRYRI